MEKAIIEVLKIWGKPNFDFDGIWYGYPALLDEINEHLEIKATLPQLKREMKSLKEKGIVDYLTTFDSEGNLCGKGYFLTD